MYLLNKVNHYPTVNKMWKIDTAKENILAIMKPYQDGIIEMILESGKTGISTFKLHTGLEAEGIIISRASVINYCKKLAANDVISFEERTGKGGYHRIYFKLMSWESIIEYIHIQVLLKLTEAFPGSKYLNDVKVALSE